MPGMSFLRYQVPTRTRVRSRSLPWSPMPALSDVYRMVYHQGARRKG